MPYAVQVQFRSAASFLVAYSVNLSRGGLFVETESDVPTGALVTLELDVPGTELTALVGVVAWRRDVGDPEGPPGLGLELQDVAPQLGAVVDRLVSTFSGVQILLMSNDKQDRTTLARNIKSIISTAEITQAADAQVASSVLSPELDAALVDVDFDVPGALAAIRTAKEQTPPVPAIALTSNPANRELAAAAGADELLANPPPFADLQVVLLRSLGKPVDVQAVITDSGPPAMDA